MSDETQEQVTAKEANKGKKGKAKKGKPGDKEKKEPAKKPVKVFNFRRLLRPLVPLYVLGLTLRDWFISIGFEPVQNLNWPVISIGNLSTGGTGKTPLAITLAKELSERGCEVDILSRGYGRINHWPVRVDPDGLAENFGDEPLLIARKAKVPVYVGAVRYEAGLLAERELEPLHRAHKAKRDLELAAQAKEDEQKLLEQDQLALPSESQSSGGEQTTVDRFAPALGSALNRATRPAARKPRDLPPVHLLDDGFQHRQLARAVNVLLMNREDWMGTLLPAGNLREPHRAAHRASVIAIPSNDPELAAAIREWGWQGPIWKLRRSMQVTVVREPVAAFCGIGHPQQFFEGLKLAKFNLVGEYAFPDHYTYTPDVLRELISEASSWGATAILTTEKDLMRMGKLAEMFPKSLPLVPVGMTTEIVDIESVLDWLEDQLTDAHEARVAR